LLAKSLSTPRKVSYPTFSLATIASELAPTEKQRSEAFEASGLSPLPAFQRQQQFLRFQPAGKPGELP